MKQPSHEVIKIDPELNMRYSSIALSCPAYNPPHWHDSIEILYIHKGSLQSVVGEETDRLVSGDFCVVDRSVVHATYTSEGIEYLLIQIPYLFLKQYVPDIDHTKLPYVCGNREKEIPCQEKMSALLRQLFLLNKEKKKGYQLTYYSLLFAFLDVLFRHFGQELSQEEAVHSQKYIERLSCIAAFVQEHYKEPISLQQGAELLALNPEYFARFFKKYMGVTFMDYVYAIRLKAAAREMISSDLTIQAVMERNGFTNPKHFNKIFYEQYGMTASAFRKNLRKDNTTKQP